MVVQKNVVLVLTFDIYTSNDHIFSWQYHCVVYDFNFGLCLCLVLGKCQSEGLGVTRLAHVTSCYYIELDIISRWF